MKLLSLYKHSVFLSSNEIHAKIFLLIFQLHGIASFQVSVLKKSLRIDPQDPLLRWKGALCFYHIILH